MNTLTKEDWVEIYYALVDKHARIDEGIQDPETKEGYCGDMESWSKHLGEIIDKIGPDGEKMYEPKKDRHYLLAIWCDIEPSLFGPFPTEEDRDKKARELHDDTLEEWGLYPVTMIWDADRNQELLVDSYSGGFWDEEEPTKAAN